MMKRYNPTIERLRERKAEREARTNTAVQMSFDVACFAAHDVFGMGPGRFPAFMAAYKKRYAEVAGLIHEDAKNDVDIEYARDTIDRGLKEIVGEDNFEPWEKRYDY